MMQDPLYREIEDRLGGTLDPELFERCAVDLLRNAYPGLSSVRGGGDAGMDGSIPAHEAPPTPLICTTSKDVIGNLTRSLRSYAAEGGRSRFAVVATSQALTPRRRRNLEKRASELGVTLLNVHAQDDFTGRLHREPQWRRELLGLSGEPPALSTLPRSRRPFEAQSLLGREEEVAWLESQQGDCLLFGQPGSGKTAILAHLALAGEGVFLVSEERGEIADAIREQTPRRIFLDDAQRRHELLVELLALRHELGAGFSVVATSWPAEAVEMQGLLRLDGIAVRDLPLLPRTLMAEIVKAVGIAGPEVLIAEILDQASGLPGLAVTLAQLSMRTGTVDLARGEYLLRDVGRTLREIVGERAIPILAAFAVGGRSGFHLNDVATALAVPPMEVHDIVTRVESGGVLTEVGRDTLAVRPPALGEALLREVFFSGAKSLSIGDLLTSTPSPAHTAATLIHSRARGTEISDDLVRGLLERCVPEDDWPAREKMKAWRLYAYTGPESVDWILDAHTHLFNVVVRPALIHRPQRSIPRLLSAALEDERDLSPNPNHPLRQIQDWIKSGRPGTDDALGRRRALLDALKGWSSQSEAVSRVTRKALAIAFSPEYTISPADPINPRQIVIHMGHLTEDEFKELQSWWPEAVDILESVGVDDVSDLEHTVHQWAFPGILKGDMSDGARAAARVGAVRMLTDLMRIGRRLPGVVAWASRLAERAELKVKLPAAIDPIYEVLFPRGEYSGDWQVRLEQHNRNARELGASWAGETPRDAAARLVGYDREGARTQRSWPRLTHLAADALAEVVDQPLDWIEVLVAEKAEPDLLFPFIWRAFLKGGDDMEAVWHRLFDIDRYKYMCMQIALRSTGVSETILERTLASLDAAENLVTSACVGDELPTERLLRLLGHPSADVSAAAAEGLWYARGRNGKLAEELRFAWRDAVVRHLRRGHILPEVFREDPSVAREWLLARQGEDVFGGFRDGEVFTQAATVLDSATRRELLEQLDADFGPPGFFAKLVGNDPDLFDVLLGRTALQSVHLEPLGWRVGSTWVELAKRALDKGYSAEDCVNAAHARGWTWMGNESAMWAGWVESYRTLEDNEDETIREIGRLGREWAEARQTVARQRERLEDVYGLE